MRERKRGAPEVSHAIVPVHVHRVPLVCSKLLHPARQPVFHGDRVKRVELSGVLQQRDVVGNEHHDCDGRLLRIVDESGFPSVHAVGCDVQEDFSVIVQQ